MAVRVLIGIPRQESAPSTLFYDCLHRLDSPPNTVICSKGRTGVLPIARNRIVSEALEMDAEFIWWLDNDQLFAPDALKQLLAHNLSAVTGVSLQRTHPFAPLLYSGISPTGWAERVFLKQQSGLLPIAGAGMHGLLIKSAVFNIIQNPWFAFEQTTENPTAYAEDLFFYRKLAEAGIQLYCDLNTRFGHESRISVWPSRDKEGNWQTTLVDGVPFGSVPSAYGETNVNI